MSERNLPFTGHLDDLRKVLVRSCLVLLATSSLCYLLVGDFILKLITTPLKRMDVSLIYIGMTEAFMTKIKLSIVAGIIISLPILFWQVWNFVSPALRPPERKSIFYILPLSFVLFGVGATFGYLVVFNFAARFLLTIVNGEVKPMISVAQYVSFLISFLLPFGMVFELPLVVSFLTKLGIVNHRMLIKYRKLAIIGITIMAAVLTPGPDIISQALLAIPMLLLYEISVIVSRIVRPRDSQLKEITEN